MTVSFASVVTSKALSISYEGPLTWKDGQFLSDQWSAWLASKSTFFQNLRKFCVLDPAAARGCQRNLCSIFPGSEVNRPRSPDLRVLQIRPPLLSPSASSPRGSRTRDLQLTNRDEEMLSDSEADYDAFDNASERVSKKLLSPNFRFFRIYATYMLLVLLLFVFFMPIRVGFFPRGR